MPWQIKSPFENLKHGGLWIPLILSCLIASITAVDIFSDLAAGATVFHVVVEAMLVLTATVGAIYFWKRLHAARQLARGLSADLDAARAKTAVFREREQELLHSLSNAIGKQFNEWDLTSTEKEIAFYLLKGLSMKEIADLRGSTDHSVKQQAYVLYHKAGLKGRAELSAYFLGGLLHLDTPRGQAIDEAKSQENDKLRSIS